MEYHTIWVWVFLSVSEKRSLEVTSSRRKVFQHRQADGRAFSDMNFGTLFETILIERFTCRLQLAESRRENKKCKKTDWKY